MSQNTEKKHAPTEVDENTLPAVPTDAETTEDERMPLQEVLDALPIADEKDIYRQFMPTAPLSMTEAAPDEVWTEEGIYWRYRVMARQADGTLEPKELIYEIDLQDAEMNRQYNEALACIDVDEAKDTDNVEAIETFWGAMRDFFDKLLGPGAGEAIVGKKANFRNAFRAYDSFIAFANKQNYQMAGAYGSAMARFRTNRSVNREQKRQQAKKVQAAWNPPVQR